MKGTNEHNQLKKKWNKNNPKCAEIKIQILIKFFENFVRSDKNI